MTRWVRELKRKLKQATNTGEGRQPILTDADKLLAETTKSKKSLNKNLKVILQKEFSHLL